MVDDLNCKWTHVKFSGFRVIKRDWMGEGVLFLMFFSFNGSTFFVRLKALKSNELMHEGAVS